MMSSISGESVRKCMKPMSERARILKAVLDFLDRDDWDEGNGFMIFGSEAYDRHLGLDLEGDPRDENAQQLWEIALTLKNSLGEEAIRKRISLIPADLNRIVARELKSVGITLTDQQKSNTLGLIAALTKDRGAAPSIGARKATIDYAAIDALLARRAVEQLDATYQRILTYDEVTIRSSTFDGAEYFEEAHRCDLNGHGIAAAVLCRAVLERALIAATDDTGWIIGQKCPNESYIELMLRQATLEGRIDESRFEAGILVRDAGNAAIHNLKDFHRDYKLRIAEIIDHTRTILEDLFKSRILG
jgi:hypothetical protein